MDDTNDLGKLKARYRDALKAAFEEETKNLSEGALRSLSDRLSRMREYAISRVDYHENQRTTYQTIALAIIAFATALIAVVADKFEKVPWFALLLFSLSLGSLIAGGVRILVKYFRETSPNYPYRAVSDIKSWYYKYNLQYSGRMSDSRDHDQFMKSAEEHAKQLISYLTTWLPHASDLKSTVLEDIEQVYILFALQHYKREFARQMAAILKVHVTLFVVFLLLGLLALIAASLL